MVEVFLRQSMKKRNRTKAVYINGVANSKRQNEKFLRFYDLRVLGY